MFSFYSIRFARRFELALPLPVEIFSLECSFKMDFLSMCGTGYALVLYNEEVRERDSETGVP